MASKRKERKSTRGSAPVAGEARPEPVVFGELRRLAQSPGFIHALAVLAFRSNVVTTSDEFTKEDFLKIYEPKNLLRTETNLFIGLMLGSVVDCSLPNPETTQRYIDEAVTLLEELHQAVLAPGREIFIAALKEHAAGNHGVKNPLSSGVILREAMFYGAESAFPFQFEALARERYEPDAQWLTEKLGFDIDQAANVLMAVRDTIREQCTSHWDTLVRQSPNDWSLLPIFTFTLDQIVTKTRLDADLVERVLDAFSVREQDSALTFKDMGEYNKASTHPIIHLQDGTRLAFLEFGLTQALYDNPFYWIAADKEYLAKHSQTRGSFVERFTERRLCDVFPNRFVYRNVVFKGRAGETLAEADAILLYGHRAFVVQAKSKRLTLASWRGDDVAIAGDFKAAVQQAYDQALECIRQIRSGVAAYVGDSKIDLAKYGDIREFYPLCITSEHYPALSSQSRLFLRMSSEADVLHPIVIDVFTLDVIAEMLDRPLYFTDYLVKRAAAADRVLASHELIVLAWYLKSNLYVSDHEIFNIMDDVLVDLDLAMTVRRAGLNGPATPRGQLTRFDGTPAGKVLDYVNQSDRPDVHRLGEVILGMNSDTADALNRGIARATKLTRADGSQHDVTVSIEGGGGITIHCNRNAPPEAHRLLEAHCAMRKYVEKSDCWYGVLVDESGEPRMMLGVEFPWHFDSRLESEAAPFRVRSVTHSLIGRRKIGRNEPCPCDSGKKYKKCCLN